MLAAKPSSKNDNTKTARRRSVKAGVANEESEPASNGDAADAKLDEAMAAAEADVKTSTSTSNIAAKTPNRGRVKRSRISDINEDAEVPLNTSTRVLRERQKSPEAESPIRDRGTASRKQVTPRPSKKPRISALPKPPKVGLNGLAGPYASLQDAPSFSFHPAYTLPTELDPRRNGTRPLSIFNFGTGDAGQFGLGTEAKGEFKRPRLNTWIETNSGSPAYSSALPQDTTINWHVSGHETSLSNGNAEKSAVAKLGKHGLEQVVCGGMHSLAIDCEGRVRLLFQDPDHKYLIEVSRSGAGASTIMVFLDA